MAKSKILILLPGYQIFGQEQALITIAQQLSKSNLEFEFFTHSEWGVNISLELTKMGFKWTSLPFGTIWSLSLTRRNLLLPLKNLFSIIAVTIKALNFQRNNNFTHIVLGNATFSFYLLPFLYFYKKKIFIIYRHGDEIATHSKFHRLLNKLLFSIVDKHVVNCLYLQNIFNKFSPPIFSQLIYNLPAKIINEDLSNRISNVPKKARSFLFVGQISKNKGADLLFEAFRQIVESYEDVKLNVVGEVPGIGSARSESILSVINEFSDKYPENITFHGYQNDVTNYYLNADVLLCPSIYNEPSANVILEAKCLGIPAIVFNVGGMPELVEHGVDGYICPNISAEDLKAGILSYIINSDKFIYEKKMSLVNFNRKFGVNRFVNEWKYIFDCEK